MRLPVTFQDVFSGYNILVASSDHTANLVAGVLVERVVTYFGTSVRILSDKGREFVSHVWDRPEDILGCTMVQTSPYHPQGKERIDRSHRIINNLIRAATAQHSEEK